MTKFDYNLSTLLDCKLLHIPQTKNRHNSKNQLVELKMDIHKKLDINYLAQLSLHYIYVKK